MVFLSQVRLKLFSPQKTPLFGLSESIVSW
jgi:hypothetical protein